MVPLEDRSGTRREGWREVLPLRVGVLIPTLQIGGLERLLVGLVKEWKNIAPGLSVSVYAFQDGPVKLELEDLEVPVSVIAPITRYDPTVALRLRSHLRRDRVELLHAHGPRAGALGRLAGSLLRLPVVYTEHNLWQKFHPISRFLNRFTYRLNTHVVAVSQAVEESIRAGSSYPAEKITRIPNGIAASDAVPANDGGLRRELGMPDDARLIGTVANLHPAKGLAFLVEAVAALAPRHPLLRCVLIGRGRGEGRRLLDRARELGVDGHVAWLGFRDDARGLLPSLDIFVLPSLIEGLPIVLLEAMHAGLPVVASSVGGVPEVVVDGETGVLVPPGDSSQLATAIDSLLGDDERRQQMGNAGRARVLRHFTIGKAATRYLDVYARALEISGAPRQPP